MSKIKPNAALGSVSADEVEATFYEAMQTADLEKLMACWADEDEIVCVHPNGPRLVGIASIRATFEVLFSNGTIRAWPESVKKIESLASCVHSVRERVEVLTDEGPREAFVIATNVYHKTPQGWRLVAHHASAGSEQDAQEIFETPHVFH